MQGGKNGRCNARPAKPLRPSLALGHLPCKGRLAARAKSARKKPPLSKGGAERSEAEGFQPVCPVRNQEE